MVFPSSLPIYPNYSHQQEPNNYDHQSQQVGIGAQIPGLHHQPPPSSASVGGDDFQQSSIQPGSMADRARLAKIHQPEAALKCPRCESTNTKFCYYNNYSLSQPRHFCKGCRRYWTRGGALRNVPVGGGCRRNKRSSKGSNRSSKSAMKGGGIGSSISSASANSSSNSVCTTDPHPHPHHQFPFLASNLHHYNNNNNTTTDSVFGGRNGNSTDSDQFQIGNGLFEFSNNGGVVSSIGVHHHHHHESQFPNSNLLMGNQLFEFGHAGENINNNGELLFGAKVMNEGVSGIEMEENNNKGMMSSTTTPITILGNAWSEVVVPSNFSMTTPNSAPAGHLL